MVSALSDFLPDPVTSLPPHDLTVLEVAEKPVGLGNLRGQDRGPLQTRVDLKGGRLLATVRFQIWAPSPSQAGALADDLHGALLDARRELWPVGFLKITPAGTSLAEHVPTLDGWRKSVDYECLYEYHYEDAGGAESLIARIPIHADPETAGAPERETNVVTDRLARWDQHAAPALILRGPLTVSGLSGLVFVPQTVPGAAVALLRTFIGASGPPAEFASVADFLTAVTDPVSPQRHARLTFASCADFLAHFDAELDSLALGDWNEDGTPDLYEGGAWIWLPPLSLPKTTDQLQLIYDPGSSDPAFDQVATVYLRARL